MVQVAAPVSSPDVGTGFPAPPSQRLRGRGRLALAVCVPTASQGAAGEV